MILCWLFSHLSIMKMVSDSLINCKTNISASLITSCQLYNSLYNKRPSFIHFDILSSLIAQSDIKKISIVCTVIPKPFELIIKNDIALTQKCVRLTWPGTLHTTIVCDATWHVTRFNQLSVPPRSHSRTSFQSIKSSRDVRVIDVAILSNARRLHSFSLSPGKDFSREIRLIDSEKAPHYKIFTLMRPRRSHATVRVDCGVPDWPWP